MKATAASMTLTFALFYVAIGNSDVFGNGAPPPNIELVTIGSPGNANDQGGFGVVNYVYHIGQFEVTNFQYAQFLNSVAATDEVSLFDIQMESSPHGGITRGGTPGTFHYELKPGMATKPVNFVSWYDAARFANWMHNGGGSADTEDGAYTLLGGTPVPDNEARIRRNAGARWFIPSESEWHKAAYFNAGTSSYYDYPTGTDLVPIAEPSPGGG
jgi:hypothetical protein